MADHSVRLRSSELHLPLGTDPVVSSKSTYVKTTASEKRPLQDDRQVSTPGSNANGKKGCQLLSHPYDIVIDDELA
jgi:hypothetical protein